MSAPSFTPKRPLRSKPTVTNLRIEFAPEKAAEIRQAAFEHGVSMRSFCLQAIDFALAHTAKPEGEQ